ncbi:MAG: sodium:solute symporter [Chitinophagaceae bacterium]
MSQIDWLVLGLTLSLIIVYGLWKSRATKNVEGYLLANRELPWYHIGLSVMATQASAITFLSGPGQGFSDGMRFIQFYFGLPLAMVVLCITFVPILHKLNVYTAYEYLEKRFDNKTRTLTAALFLLQRGLSTGITIYAPAIILSTILSIDIRLTILMNGLLVITYTVYGGAKAVSYTQMLQMGIIFSGLFIAAYMVMDHLPENIKLSDALHIAGKMDKLNAIDTKFDLDNRYNIWSGIIGGFFLQLSYFGTDQSQVGRYLTGSSVNQSRMGLIMNALVKIPMQFVILLIGVLVFVFYQFHSQPMFFNQTEINRIENSTYASQYHALEREFILANSEKKKGVEQLAEAIHADDQMKMDLASEQVKAAEKKSKTIRDSARHLMTINHAAADTNDSNYVFLIFVTKHLPVGIVGLLIAVIFLASMGSTASGLNSLASTTAVDFYKRIYRKDASEAQYLKASRWSTFFWGLFCVVVALFASKLGNLIEAVNILGSLFYGTILGIFMVAFYMKWIGGKAVSVAAIVAELFVVLAWMMDLTAFLWLNLIGCLLVMLIAALLQKRLDIKKA